MQGSRQFAVVGQLKRMFCLYEAIGCCSGRLEPNRLKRGSASVCVMLEAWSSQNKHGESLGFPPRKARSKRASLGRQASSTPPAAFLLKAATELAADGILLSSQVPPVRHG